jgi:predicted esterase
MTNVPASGNQTIDVNGTQRQYIVTVPSGYDPNKPYRLIFAWHGLGGTAMQIASNYYGLASRSGGSAIFIAGQGLPGTGQQSGLATWTIADDSDVVFTRKMLEWAKANYCIDVKRVFSIGMSAGGMMSNIVGCELGDSFRAMVAMSGGGPKGYATKPCTGQLAVWISHGNMWLAGERWRGRRRRQRRYGCTGAVRSDALHCGPILVSRRAHAHSLFCGSNRGEDPILSGLGSTASSEQQSQARE